MTVLSTYFTIQQFV